MNLALVAVIGFFVSFARSEVKRASDFLINQDVRIGCKMPRIKPERKTPPR
jgi:hypothetical protein